MSEGEEAGAGDQEEAPKGAPPVELHGTLHGLARKVGKIGGEVLVFQITSHNHELWGRMLLLAEQDVTISLSAQQGTFGGMQPGAEAPKKKRGRPRRQDPGTVEK